MPTKIEWCEESWNPVTGCTKISTGCKNCYAEKMAKRLAGRFDYPADDPFKVTIHPNKLNQPLKWKKSRKIFVCSMGDLFHKDVPFDYIVEVLKIVDNGTRHTFLILTKRPERMREFFNDYFSGFCNSFGPTLRNLWLGVSVENQQTADERIPILLRIPAAVRFVSVEPSVEGRFEKVARWENIKFVIADSTD